MFVSPTHPTTLFAKCTLELIIVCTSFQNPVMSLFIIDLASESARILISFCWHYFNARLNLNLVALSKGKILQIEVASTSLPNNVMTSNIMKFFHLFIKTIYNVFPIIINAARSYTLFTSLFPKITN